MTEQQMQEALDRVTFHTQFEALEDADFIIECAAESIETKREVFQKLEKIVGKDVILASNTSSLSLTRIAGTVPKRADKVVGMHFFNPVPIMPLLEVVTALQTSQDTIDKAIHLGKELNKVPIVVKDSPGFACNRILLPYLNEAITTL
mmetsp:Transcript_18385/g.13381  ORF Transcript_18385/g.13381 Transcript_18385/m.13381 type:complete len:148 (+) Transcript_18385:227-670(+)